MKRLIYKSISILLCFAIAIVFAIPVFAVEEHCTSEMEDYADKLFAFWQQEAYGGLINGEAVYDHEWLEGVNYLWDEQPSYDGSWYTDLVDPIIPLGWYDLRFKCDYSWSAEEEVDGFIYAIDGTDTLTPDLYGPLDLSHTALYRMWAPEQGQTHITSVDLDGCIPLSYVCFSGQEHCKTFSALGCTSLETVDLSNGAFESIRLSLLDFDESILLSAFGNGTVGLIYNADTNDCATLIANASDSGFVGWYSGGEQVSTEYYYSIKTGGRYTACFAGDANCDGLITSTDALIIMRTALGISQNAVSVNSADINADGAVDSADALSVLRLSMGLL